MIIIALILFVVYATARYQANDICSLTNDGWVLYHSATCSYCVKQLEGISWKRIWLNEVECNTNTQQCSSNGINAFPTWVNVKTGSRHEGSIPYDKLTETLAKANR